MKVSIEWLKDFTPIIQDPKKFCEGMTMSGSKVEGCETQGSEIKQVVTGRIISIARHPDADKLVICQVDTGSRTLQVVTGATNLYSAAVVPVALDGAGLPGGIQIQAGLLRGQISEGMLCSISELGYTAADFPEADPEGIFLLPGETPVGLDIRQALHLDDLVIDFEITSNRVDCFSVEGLGREAAVTFDLPFMACRPSVRANCPEQSAELASISIEAPDLCYRYVGRVVRNAAVGASPEWLRRRLRCAGVRSINNIVDITNYVMLELGQPMHAFDLTRLAGRQIRVRRAADGETMRTLDSIDRELDSSMLVIADAQRAVALAGVMGAENSEITRETRTILLESATFNPRTVRQAAHKVGLRTEASSRFEKGLDAYNAGRAMDRACQLIELLQAGDVCQGAIDAWPVRPSPVRLSWSPESVNRFLGTQISAEWMVECLRKLGLVIEKGKDSWSAVIPSFRPDLAVEADLAEEAARIYGYNRIEPSLLSGKQTTLGGRSPEQKLIEKTKDLLLGQGFFEACTYSFESPRQLDRLLVPPDHALRRQVLIQNPLGDDYSVMRTSLMPSLLEAAATNWNRSTDEARLFEIACTYHPESLPLTSLPRETRRLAALIYDCQGRGSSGEVFFMLKGAAEELFRHLGVTGISYRPESHSPWLHPGQAAKILLGGRQVGLAGVIHPDVAANFQAPPQTALLDLDLQLILTAASRSCQIKPLPRFPAVTRDLALLAADSVPADDLAAAIQAGGGPILEQIRLFDVYQGQQVPPGKKSVAYSLVFRSGERTLNDADIQPVMQRILQQLKDRCQAVIRE